MKTIIFFLLIFFSHGGALFSQQVISPMGADLKTAQGAISATLGEPVIATFQVPTGIITQGFQQSRLTVTGSERFLKNAGFLNVYPNPVADILFISIDPAELGNTAIILYDLTGKALSTLKPNQDLTEIDFSDYTPGIYLLKVLKDEKSLGTYKIVKQK